MLENLELSRAFRTEKLVKIIIGLTFIILFNIYPFKSREYKELQNTRKHSDGLILIFLLILEL